jgi:hypothetical protein
MLPGASDQEPWRIATAHPLSQDVTPAAAPPNAEKLAQKVGPQFDKGFSGHSYLC